MTVYHAGCEPNVMTFNLNPVTTAGTFDSNYARCAIEARTSSGGSLTTSSLVGDNSATGWWLHFKWRSPIKDPHTYTTTDRANWESWLFYVLDATSAGNISAGVIGIDATYGQMQARLYSYDSATFTSGTSWVFNENTLYDVDVHCWTDGADSRLQVWMNGTLTWDITRAGDDNNGLQKVVFRSVSNYDGSSHWHYFSEVIVADTDTRGWHVKTLPPTGNSATNTAWTGSYTDVDEITPDGNAAYSSAVGQLETYTMGTVGAGQGLVAVAVGTLIAGNGTNDCQAVIRKGGTDYVSADLGLTTGQLPYCTVWNTDPTDSQPWDAGETLSGVEFGVKSVT